MTRQCPSIVFLQFPVFFSFLLRNVSLAPPAAASTREQVDGGSSGGKDALGSVGWKGRRRRRTAWRQRERS